MNIQANSVIYTREFTSTNWQALYVPFNITVDEVNKYGKVIELYTVVVDDGYNLHYKAVESDCLVPNTPYLFMPKEAGEISFVASECNVEKAENNTIGEDGEFEGILIGGIYVLKTDMYETGAYALSGNYFKRASKAGVNLKPFRIFLTLPNNSASQMPVRIVVDDEELSGIDGVIVATPEGEYYDLQGRKIAQPSNGIFIYNGQKIQINTK